MSIPRLLKHRATIERSAASADAGGVVSREWSVVAQDVPCGLFPAGGGGEQDAVAELLGAEFVVYFEGSEDVGPQDQDGRSDRVTIDQVKYMTRLVEDMGGRNKMLKVYLVREA